MNEYIIVRSQSSYKIYFTTPELHGVYQYTGASFMTLTDAKDFVALRNGDYDAA